jgi:Family of unknown function (DUF6114)
MTIATSPESPSTGGRVLHGLRRARLSFRHWRKGRPFNGGFWVLFAGVELMLAPASSIGVIVHEGIAGVSAFFLGGLMIMFGLSIWFAPSYRMFAGIASIMLALIALPATNYGGFLIGTLCGVTGGALSTAWTPRPGWQAPTRRQRRTQAVAPQPADVGPDDPADTAAFEAAQEQNPEIAGAATATGNSAGTALAAPPAPDEPGNLIDDES